MAKPDSTLPSFDNAAAVPAANPSTSPTATGTGTGSAIDTAAADARGAGLHSGLTPAAGTPATATTPIVGDGSKPLVPAEGGILAQAKEMAKPYIAAADKTARPYIEKAQAAAQPYTDAAVAKASELKGQFDRPKDGVTATNTAGAGGAHLSSAAPHAGQPQATTAEKAKGMFDYGLATLKSAYTQVGKAIDDKTATPEKPGLFTQASTAVQQGVQQLEKAVAGESHGAGAAGAGAAAGAAGAAGGAAAAGHDASTAASTHEASLGSAVTPGAAGATATAGVGGASAAHPIATTTNTLAHNSNDADPK